MVRHLLVAFLVTAAVAGRAHAGLDCDGPSALADLEAFAADKSKAEQMDKDYAWLCIGEAIDKSKPRIEKACRKILDRDGDQSRCVTVAAAAGFTKLGDHDLFTLVTKLHEDPIDSPGDLVAPKSWLLANMGDPRGTAYLVELWKASIPRADAREKRHGEMASWSGWRQNTAEALGTLGDADTKTFLEEQAKATKDTHVRDACNAAAAAIGKRLAAKSP